MKILGVLLVVAFLGACTTMDSVMQSQVGRSVDGLIAQWGAPQSKHVNAAGGTTYTWITTKSNGYEVSQCRQSFTADKGGIIRSYSFSNCPKFVKS